LVRPIAQECRTTVIGAISPDRNAAVCELLSRARCESLDEKGRAAIRRWHFRERAARVGWVRMSSVPTNSCRRPHRILNSPRYRRPLATIGSSKRPFFDGGVRLFAVGDADQSVYGFSGPITRCCCMAAEGVVKVERGGHGISAVERRDAKSQQAQANEQLAFAGARQYGWRSS
jgi:hypothetical protein